MIILPEHIGLSCKVNVIRLERCGMDIPLDMDFPFIIVGISKNTNRALISPWNDKEVVFSVAGFNVILNRREWRSYKENKGII